MKKKVVVSLCLLIAISLIAIAAWIRYLNIASMTDISSQNMDYQITCREWLDCLGE